MRVDHGQGDVVPAWEEPFPVEATCNIVAVNEHLPQAEFVVDGSASVPAVPLMAAYSWELIEQPDTDAAQFWAIGSIWTLRPAHIGQYSIRLTVIAPNGGVASTTCPLITTVASLPVEHQSSKDGNFQRDTKPRCSYPSTTQRRRKLLPLLSIRRLDAQPIVNP
jgi:hypothetical protein